MRKYQQYYKAQLRKKKKSIFKNRFLWFFSLGFLFFLGIFYFLFFSPVFQADKIIIQGTHFINKHKVEGLTELKLDKRTFLSSTKSLFALNGKSLKKSIIDSFFPAQNVVIKKHLFHKSLSIDIQERKPQAICCDQEQCFFVDKQGIIFQPVSLEKNKSLNDFNMPIIRFSDKMKIKDNVLSSKTLEQIILIFSEAKRQKDFNITEFKISSSTIEAKANNQASIYFNGQKDIGQQLQDLFIFLDNQFSEVGASKIQRSLNDIEYIDLRFDKIFYK